MRGSCRKNQDSSELLFGRFYPCEQRFIFVFPIRIVTGLYSFSGIIYNHFQFPSHTHSTIAIKRIFFRRKCFFAKNVATGWRATIFVTAPAAAASPTSHARLYGNGTSPILTARQSALKPEISLCIIASSHKRAAAASSKPWREKNQSRFPGAGNPA